MSDAFVALILGSVLWLAGGVGGAVSLFTGAGLFVPFAAAVVALGVGICVVGVVWLIQS